MGAGAILKAIQHPAKPHKVWFDDGGGRANQRL